MSNEERAKILTAMLSNEVIPEELQGVPAPMVDDVREEIADYVFDLIRQHYNLNSDEDVASHWGQYRDEVLSHVK